MTSRHTPRHALLGSLAAAALLALSGVAAHAQDKLASVEPANSTMYQNGGIGHADQEFMRNSARDWPLRMTFSAQKDNAFVAGVQLSVTNSDGKTVLQLGDAGPMTYVNLPPGKYRVSARYNGQLETREVTLDGNTGHNVYFHWQGTPQT